MSPEPLATEAIPLWTGFTAFDWLIVALLAASTLLAFLRGAISETASLLGSVAGLLVAAWNYPAVAHYLQRWVSSGPLTDMIAFLLVASAVMVLCSLAGRLVRSGAHSVGLGFADRAGGAALGFVRGVLACAALAFALTAFLPPQTSVVRSRLAPYLLAAAHGVSSVVPQHLERRFAAGAADLMHTRAQQLGPPAQSGDEGHTPARDSK